MSPISSGPSGFVSSCLRTCFLATIINHSGTICCFVGQKQKRSDSSFQNAERKGEKLGRTSIEIFKGQDGQVHSISFHFIPTYALQCTAIVHAETSFSHSRPPERPVEPQAVSEADNLFLVYNVYIIMCNVCIYRYIQ